MSEQAEIIEFACPGCQARLKVPGRHAGGRATCPSCKQALEIPRASRSTLSSTPPAPAPAPRATSRLEERPDSDPDFEVPRKRRRVQRSGMGKTLALVIGGVVAAGAVVVLLLLLLGGKASADFDLVPRNVKGFMTIRVADAIESEPVKKVMDAIEKAGGEPGQMLAKLNELEAQIGLKRTDVERLTLVIEDENRMLMWVLVHTKKDVEKGKVLGLLEAEMGGRQERQHEGKTFYVLRNQRQFGEEFAIHFASSRLTVIAPPVGMERCLAVSRRGPGSGPLEDSIELASGDRYHAVVGVNAQAIVPEMLKNQRGMPGAEEMIKQSVKGFKAMSFAVRIDKKMEALVSADFDDSKTAEQFAVQMEAGLGMVKAMAKGQGRNMPEMAPLMDALDKLKTERSGATVKLQTELDTEVLMGTLLPAIQNVRGAAARSVMSNNLKQIMLAMHNHESATQHFPTPALSDRAGRPVQLSWRVAILPYIEQDNLYRQFKLDEPWNSPHNIKLLSQMPKIYEDPNRPAPQGQTYVQMFVGPNTLHPFNPGQPKPRITNILDGTSNTILVTTGEQSVPWTAPQDIVVDQGPVRAKLHWEQWGVLVGFCDGSVRALKPTMSDRMLRLLIDPRDGQIVNPDE